MQFNFRRKLIVKGIVGTGGACHGAQGLTAESSLDLLGAGSWRPVKAETPPLPFREAERPIIGDFSTFTDSAPAQVQPIHILSSRFTTGLVSRIEGYDRSHIPIEM